jgi:hypothetical protein
MLMPSDVSILDLVLGLPILGPDPTQVSLRAAVREIAKAPASEASP